MPITNREKEILVEVSKQQNIKLSTGWKNFSENLDSFKAMVMDVEDIESLSSLLLTVHKLNEEKQDPSRRIILRAAAGGRGTEYSESYSFTPGAEADVIVRLVGPQFRYIQKTSEPNVMSVGASVQIGELDKELYEKHNLSLPTSSLISYPTVGGLIANSGHGTGKDQPGFCGLVRAMTFCLPNGKIVRIDNKHKDFEAIRGSNLGLFGIALGFELECTEAKNMLCVKDVCSVPELIKKIKEGLFYKYPYTSVMYMPTYQEDEMTSEKYKNVVIYNWMPVDKDMKAYNNSPLLSSLAQQLEIKSEKAFQITNLFRTNPDIIPCFMRHLVTKAAIGSKDEHSIGPWPSVHYQTEFPRDIDDADYLFEVSKDCNEIVKALEAIVSSLTRFAAKGQYPVTSAMYFRFFDGTNGPLSSSVHAEGKKVCGLDMVSSNGIAGYSEFKREMAEYFIYGELHSKPHWGKYVPLEVDYRKMYGAERFDSFVNTLESWYQDNNIKISHSMLLNSFLCKILQLPYQPHIGLETYRAFNHVITESTTKLTARGIAKTLDKNTDEARELKRRLQELGEEKASKNTATMFGQPSARKPEKEVKEEREHKQRSCVLF